MEPLKVVRHGGNRFMQHAALLDRRRHVLHGYVEFHLLGPVRDNHPPHAIESLLGHMIGSNEKDIHAGLLATYNQARYEREAKAARRTWQTSSIGYWRAPTK